jgi:hypothetical protein
LRWSLSARFFLTQWALHAQVAAPDATALSSRPPLDWLRANALSAAEHAALGGRQELAGWLLAQPPEAFGHASILQDEALLPAVPELDLEALRSVCSRQALARALPLGRRVQRFRQPALDRRSCDVMVGPPGGLQCSTKFSSVLRESWSFS